MGASWGKNAHFKAMGEMEDRKAGDFWAVMEALLGLNRVRRQAYGSGRLPCRVWPWDGGVLGTS